MILAAAFGLTGLLVRSTTLEPKYEGLTLSQWLSRSENAADLDQATMAVGLMRAEAALPFLQKYWRTGSHLERKLYQACSDPIRHRFWRNRIWDLYHRKLAALRVAARFFEGPVSLWFPDRADLATQFRAAAPELIAMATDPTEFADLRSGAVRVLQLISGEPSPLVLSTMKDLTKDANPAVSQAAATCLRSFRDRLDDAKRRRLIVGSQGIDWSVSPVAPALE